MENVQAKIVSCGARHSAMITGLWMILLAYISPCLALSISTQSGQTAELCVCVPVQIFFAADLLS